MRIFLVATFALLFPALAQAGQSAVLLPENDQQQFKPETTNSLGLVPDVTKSQSKTQTVAPRTSDKPSTTSTKTEAAPALSPEQAQAQMEKILNDNLRGLKDSKVFKDIVEGKKTPDQMTDQEKKELFQAVNDAVKVKGPIAITPGGTPVPETKSKEQQMAEEVLGKANAVNVSRPPSSMQAYLEKARDALEAQLEAQRPKKEHLFLDEIALSGVDDSGFKNALHLVVSPEYTWGEHDLLTLSRTLGYDRNAVPKNCQLRLDAILETDDGTAPYFGTILAGGQRTIKYNGALRAVKLTPRALCNPPQTLPKNGGIITKTGDKYSVLLMRLPPSCATADRVGSYAPSGLAVQYTGDSQVKCLFQ